jgi:hypothetical protein
METLKGIYKGGLMYRMTFCVIEIVDHACIHEDFSRVTIFLI